MTSRARRPRDRLSRTLAHIAAPALRVVLALCALVSLEVAHVLAPDAPGATSVARVAAGSARGMVEAGRDGHDQAHGEDCGHRGHVPMAHDESKCLLCHTGRASSTAPVTRSIAPALAAVPLRPLAALAIPRQDACRLPLGARAPPA